MQTLFPEFRDAIAAGADPLSDPRLRLAADERFTIVYTPFERVTRTARLAIVGMTPGPDQLKPAYATARVGLATGKTDAEIMREILTQAAFGGKLRTPLIKMLRHFGIAEILKIGHENDLWDSASEMLHSTSIIPHAAFKNGKRFSGNRFAEILDAPLLRACFETSFVPTLALLTPDCRFIGLGRLAGEALDWCVAQGLLQAHQLLGTMPHPSRVAGSQVRVFLREIDVTSLDRNNPVRNRSVRMARDYERMTAQTAIWRREAVVAAA